MQSNYYTHSYKNYILILIEIFVLLYNIPLFRVKLQIGTAYRLQIYYLRVQIPLYPTNLIIYVILHILY
jgi:hypothetical protein